MIQNNNLSVLPWYDSISQQNHRKDYAFGNVFPLITPDRRLPPFQIIRSTRTNQISQVLLKTLDGELVANITGAMKETGLVIKKYANDGYDLLKYPGILPMDINTPEGQYYAEISDGIQRWYSEVFTIKRNIGNDYLTIEWWDDDTLYFNEGCIDYEHFKNKVYLCTQVGKPDYKYEEDGSNKDSYFFAEKQISKKIYKFNFLAPEYLLDAMRLIFMSDHIEIKSHDIKYNVDRFLMVPKWQEQGDLAAVEAEFETDTVIKKIAKGYLEYKKPPFNLDYNSDFNIGMSNITFDNIINDYYVNTDGNLIKNEKYRIAEINTDKYRNDKLRFIFHITGGIAVATVSGFDINGRMKKIYDSGTMYDYHKVDVLLDISKENGIEKIRLTAIKDVQINAYKIVG